MVKYIIYTPKTTKIGKNDVIMTSYDIQIDLFDLFLPLSDFSQNFLQDRPIQLFSSLGYFGSNGLFSKKLRQNSEKWQQLRQLSRQNLI